MKFIDTQVSETHSQLLPITKLDQRREYNGKIYKFLGKSEENCKFRERVGIGFRVLKAIFSLVLNLFSKKTREDELTFWRENWLTFWTGKKIVAIYSSDILPVGGLDDKQSAHINTIREIILKDERLIKLFDVINNKSSLGLREYFDQIGKENVLKLLHHVNLNYALFQKWMKEIGEIESREPVLELKKEIRVEKGILFDDIYANYAKLVYEIANVYKDLLVDKVRRGSDPLEFYPLTLLMPAGMRILVRQLREVGTFTKECFVCESYQHYKQQLESIRSRDKGKWYFIIRCKEEGTDHGCHQSFVYLEKKNGKTKTLVLDSGALTDNKVQKCITKLATFAQQVFPETEIYTTLLTRQYDAFNCGVIVLKDVKALNRINANEYAELFNTAELAEKYLPEHIPLRKHIKALASLPLPFIKPIQSLTKLNGILAEKNLDKAKLDKMQKLQRSYTIVDPKQDKDMYVYTKCKGISYRLKVILDTFENIY